MDANIWLNIWSFHLAHLGFSQLQKEEAGGKKYPPHKTFTSRDFVEGRESDSLFVEQMFLQSVWELKEWQIGLPRIQNETSRQLAMPPTFSFEKGGSREVMNMEQSVWER